MSSTIDPQSNSWTAADLVDRFGPIPLARIWLDPAPGSGTEKDVVRIHDHENRLCELVDGTLVEKTVGTYESYLAILIARHLGNFAAANDIGAADRSADRDAVTHAFANTDDVRSDPVSAERVHRPGSSETRLHFIQNQQQIVLSAEAFEQL